jgi:3',5'-cyclic AMP phosphodiesterase CpdA
VSTPREAGVTEPASTAVRIAHVSDIHVGAHDDLALDGLVADLHAADVAATVVTGDLTMRARSHQFARAVEAVGQFPPPTIVVLGNHDIPLLNSFRRLAAPYAKYLAAVTDDLDPVLDLATVRIQGLASMPRWRWKSGRVSSRQADLIRATFADSPAGTARVVALHHPPSLANLDSMAGRAEFERALVDAEVDVVLAGHTHVPAVRVLQVGPASASRQVIEVVAGTATSHRTRGLARSWSLLEFTAATIVVTEHSAEGRLWRPQPAHELALPPGRHRPSESPG